MAEAFVNDLCPESFEAESAGLEPGTLNPLVVEVMRELGMDISGKRTRSLEEAAKTGRRFDYVVTVCEPTKANAEIELPGSFVRQHWDVPDPAAIQGSYEEKLGQVRLIRNMIRRLVKTWCSKACLPGPPKVF